MADGEESVKSNSNRTLDGSSSEDENGRGESGENEEAVKTFKDLVGLSHATPRVTHFRLGAPSSTVSL